MFILYYIYLSLVKANQIYSKPRRLAKVAKLYECGPKRIRTADLLIANEALYQLSYGPNA